MNFNLNLAKAIAKFCREKNLEFILNLGCGEGEYVNYFNENDFSLMAVGCDSNKDNVKAANLDIKLPLCYTADVRQEINFKFGLTPDLIMSLDILFEDPVYKVFCGNLTKYAKDYVLIRLPVSFHKLRDKIISERIIGKMRYFKFAPDLEASASITVDASEFKDSLMVFKRIK